MLVSDQVYTWAVLVAALGLFVWGKWRYDLVALAALLAMVLRGVVPAEAAFSGFAHPAVITVAAVLVVSRGLLNAGVVDAIARRLMRLRGGPSLQVALLCGLTAACSGFMNNVGALALLMPVAVWMARRGGYAPSLVLMPLAFSSLLGGMTTLLGTPPNLIVAAFRPESAGPPFGMFDFLPVGGAVALGGVGVLSVTARWLVPGRPQAGTSGAMFAIDDYVAELRVPAGCKLAGRTLHDLESTAESEHEVRVIALIRQDRLALAPSSYEVLRAEDRLLVEAKAEDLKALLDATHLELAESRDEGIRSLQSEEVQLREAVVGQHSSLLGRTAAEVDLRQRLHVNLLAVARSGQQLRQPMSKLRFLLGDILLLQGSPQALAEAMAQLGCLPLEQRDLALGKKPQMLPAGGIFLAALTASALGFVPIQIAMLAAALAMVVLRLLPLREAYDAIDWPVVVLLGAMMPVGLAFESTGAAQVLAEQVATLSQGSGGWVSLLILLVATMLLSNVINNAAAALLMAPVAVRMAQATEVSVDALLMGVAVGASAAFLTPIGHQSNTLVMEPGGYRFGDYWPLGLVLSLAVTVLATPLLLRVWG